MKPLTIAALGIIFGAYLLPDPHIERAPGILAPDEPRQGLASAASAWEVGGYRVAPLATFRIRARVLLKERYWLGRESDLSPIDLTLGWGGMSDTDMLQQFHLWRGHRCYFWKPRSAEASRRASEAAARSANVHLVPASAQVRDALFQVRRGNIVDMEGFLVEATAPDGWRWRSSLTRSDSGPGACELMWVEWVRTE